MEAEVSMIELTQEQRQAMQREKPLLVNNPETRTDYVLVRASVYAQVKSLLDQLEQQAEQASARPATWDEIFARKLTVGVPPDSEEDSGNDILF
jgi:hypothetical protein